MAPLSILRGIKKIPPNRGDLPQLFLNKFFSQEGGRRRLAPGRSVGSDPPATKNFQTKDFLLELHSAIILYIVATQQREPKNPPKDLLRSRVRIESPEDINPSILSY